MKKNFICAVFAAAAFAFASCEKENMKPDTTTGLIGYYSFDECNGIDLSGERHNGEFAGEAQPEFIDGVAGKALYINGDNNISFKIPYVFFRGLESWTVSFWAKDVHAGSFFSAQDLSIPTRHYDVPRFFADNNTKTFGIQTQSDSYSFFSYNYTQHNDEWHHIVVVLDSLTPVSNAHWGYIKLYVDGKLQDESKQYYYKSYINDCSQTTFGGNKGNSNYLSIDTKIDEIRIYNRNLKQADIKALYDLEY